MVVHLSLSNRGEDKMPATSEWRMNERHEGIELPVAMESNVLEDRLALNLALGLPISVLRFYRF
jgi:hypothetical protein